MLGSGTLSVCSGPLLPDLLYVGQSAATSNKWLNEFTLDGVYHIAEEP
jgi:hypothetical protein